MILKNKVLSDFKGRTRLLMDINLFDFNLPEHLIAQNPADKRENSRLLVLNKKKEKDDWR